MEILPNIDASSRLADLGNFKMFNDRKQLWFQGPPWLREPEDTWPPQPRTSIHTEYESLQTAVTIMADIEENPNILNIVDF